MRVRLKREVADTKGAKAPIRPLPGPDYCQESQPFTMATQALEHDASGWMPRPVCLVLERAASGRQGPKSLSVPKTGIITNWPACHAKTAYLQHARVVRAHARVATLVSHKWKHGAAPHIDVLAAIALLISPTCSRKNVDGTAYTPHARLPIRVSTYAHRRALS